VKSWLVIPAMGLASGAAVIAVTRDPFAIAAASLAGAALAAAVRGLAGDTPASLVAAVLAPLLVLASFAEHGLVHAVPLCAIAAIAWTVVELARTTTSPLVAMLPATIAAVLDPAAVVLVAIAGVRLVTAPWPRPSWAIAVPIAGVLGVVLAAIAGSASHGTFGALGAHWFGPAHPVGAPVLARITGDALGPLTAVAAIAGLALIARPRLAELAVIGCAIGALLVDARAGVTGETTLGIAGFAAALAIGRFASTIRMPSLQAVAGATAAIMLLVPPALTVISR
jgi:hypothetical protein